MSGSRMYTNPPYKGVQQCAKVVSSSRYITRVMIVISKKQMFQIKVDTTISQTLLAGNQLTPHPRQF